MTNTPHQRVDGARPPMLSRAEFEAGKPCPACGQPYRDGRELPGAELQRTPEQQAAYEREHAGVRARHPDCEDGWFGVAGSRTLHCNRCCPPPPLSKRQAGRISALLFGPHRRPAP
jgi:hypothetical protein